MTSFRDRLQAAWEHQRAGRSDDARALVRELLSAEPANTAALRLHAVVASPPGQRDPQSHNELGVEFAKLSMWDSAEECFRRAVSEQPNFAPGYANLGNVLSQQGRLAEAIDAYRQALALAPAEAQISLQLANCLHAQSNFTEAVEYYERALAGIPQDALIYFRLGQSLTQSGKLDQAAARFVQALRLRGDFAEAHAELGFVLRALARPEALQALQAAAQLNPILPGVQLALGDLLFDRGNVTAAIEHYRLAIARQPNSVAAHTSLGNALRAAGSLEESLRHYEYVARLRPDLPEAHVNLGLLHQQQKNSDAAIDCFRRALEIRPELAPAHNGLGVALESQGKSAEAVGCFREAIRLQPDYVEAHSNLGASLGELGKTSAGIAAISEGRAELERAVALDPDFAQAHGNLGKLLMGQNADPHTAPEAIQTARQALERALQLNPELIEARGNLAKLLGEQGDLTGALFQYDEALRRDPSSAAVHNNRAMTLLLAGDFTRGWPEYEWRWRLPDAPQIPWQQPEWDGSPLPDGTIMLHCEQGLGDTLQFLRYAPQVQERCARLVIAAPSHLLPILRTCVGLDPARVEFHDDHAKLPPIDARASFMSLPRILRTELSTIPATVPYLAVDELLIARWRKSLGDDDVFRVGVVWQGNPKFGGDRARSFPLAILEPLAKVPGARVFSLQKGFGAEQLAGVDFPIVDLGSQFSEEAMIDAAAVIRSLDLVIACDTAMLHLAGALAAPVWGAIPFAPDWRWMLDRDDSPWYPTLRLFRQARMGDWPEVIARMAAELTRLADKAK
jgi:tetratricopeptide (TPR) repeat protein